MNRPLFIIVDGSSYLYRAFHALPPLNNSRGEPTGAVYGVANMLKRLRNDYQPYAMVVVFDAKGKNFRHALYADYKAHRPPMPDDLRAQIQPLSELIDAMGLPQLSIEGVEADDVIGTLAREAEARNWSVIISTGDKDMAQLVNENITLINTMNNSKLDRQGVIEKFGITPEQIVDYLSLVGDSVDNVPGVPQCGPKTAVKWLQQYQTLDNLCQHANEVTGKIGEKLRETLSYLPLAKQLVTIKTDVMLDVHPDQFLPKEADPVFLKSILQQLEFKAWSNEIDSPLAISTTLHTSEHNVETIYTEDALLTWINELKQAALFAFDTETTNLDPLIAELVGISFAINADRAGYIPIGHTYIGAPVQLTIACVLNHLKPLLEDPSILKICQHGKYDTNVLEKYDITLQGIAYDTMLESYCLNSTATRHNLEDLAQYYLKKSSISFESIAGKGSKQLTFDQIAIDIASEYAGEDAVLTYQLHQTLWPMLSTMAGPHAIFTEIEIPLVAVLAKIERQGVLIDSHKLIAHSQQLKERMAVLQGNIFDMAGESFNLESPKQLQEILFEKLQLPVIKKTPTGQPSTAEPILQELALEYSLPALIMEYRTLSKLKSTYTDKLPLMINKKTGRVHTSYNQTVASTGRLSSSDPNLQNIPVRTEEGRAIRAAFIAPTGYQLISADYSQIELRIMAELSQDTSLLNAFKANLDIHKATAAEIFGVSLENVSNEQRRKAKAINFGLIYGMSAFGLAKQIKVGRHEAQDYINIYFERYPGVKKYMESSRELAHTQGYVTTLRGRRLYLPDINAKNKMMQQASERLAINAPMQGTAADIIKQAMLDVDRWLMHDKIEAHMILQVHDELVLEVADHSIEEVKTKLPAIMIAAAKLNVPMQVDVGIGLNWDAAH